MLQLLLLRHAKSDWSEPGRADFDRPLNGRGRQAAPLMGRYLREHDLVPDLTFCSSARRARDTWALVAQALGATVPVDYLDGLYMAAPAKLLTTARTTGDQVRRLLMIGHNPGLERFAELLAGSGDRRARQGLSRKFPTAGLAVFGFAAAGWPALRPGEGRLDRFVVPKELA